MPPKQKQQLDKAAWSWTDTTHYTEVKEDHVKIAYRLNLTTCERGSCKRNCKGNPFCLNNLGEKKWFVPLDESKFQQFNPEESRRQEGNFVGLKNLGATCYVNTFLQLWFHNPTVRRAVYEWRDATVEDKYVEGWRPDSICGHLQLIFALMENSKRCYVDPSPLIECLGLDAGEQQDAQEFSKLFLHVLESALSGDVPGRSNVIEQQFCGKYCYVTICQNCGSHSETPATFYELDLNIRGHSSLTASIKDFLQEEKLEGDNQYMCSYCNSKQNATRAIQLKALPPVLNLQLLRFVFDKNKGHKKKLSSFIQFPETLDMSPYLCDGEEAVYNLVAVLIHSGSTAHSGHYIAHIKERESDLWYKFNDEDIEKMKNRKLELGKEDEASCVSPLEGNSEKTPKLAKGVYSSRNAYMLVYSRCENKEEGTKCGVVPVPFDLLPANVKGCVEKDNQDFEDWIQDRLRDESEAITNKKQSYEEMKYLYTSLPVKTLAEPWEWITMEWLTKWLNDPMSVSKVSNQVPKCSHGKIPADEVTKLKCISEAAASCMFAKYPVDKRFNGPSMLCETCIRLRCRQIRFKSCMTEDDKLFSSLKNGKNSKISLPLDPSEELFWVSTKHLRSWKKFALQNMSTDETSLSSITSPVREVTAYDTPPRHPDSAPGESPNQTPTTTQSPTSARIPNGQDCGNDFENPIPENFDPQETKQYESQPHSTPSPATTAAAATATTTSNSEITMCSKSSISLPSLSKNSPVYSSSQETISTHSDAICHTSTSCLSSSEHTSHADNHIQQPHSSSNHCQLEMCHDNLCPDSCGVHNHSVHETSEAADNTEHSAQKLYSSPSSLCHKSCVAEQDSGKDNSVGDKSDKNDSMDEGASSETCESPDSGIIVLKTTMRDFCDNQEADLASAVKLGPHSTISSDKVEHEEDEDIKDDEMSDDQEEKNELFNNDILCHHGNLRVDEGGRRLVKKEVWDRLLYYFPHLEPFTATSDICQLCLESLQFEYTLKQNRKQAGQGQKDVLQDLYHSRNRPKTHELWAGRSAYIVSSNFLDGWRKFVKHSMKLDSDLEIVNAPLLCEHDLLLYKIEDMNTSDSSTRFTLVWDDEWQKLTGYFNFDVKIQVIQSFNGEIGRVTLKSEPDVCDSCLSERIRQEEEGKFVFSAQTVYVRKVVDGQKFEGKGDDLDGKTKGYNYDPEFSAPPPEKMAKMESNGQRKSSRHRKTRGEKEVIVSSGMTLKEFKIKADEPSGEAVMEQEDFMNAPSRPEEGFKGTNLMGR